MENDDMLRATSPAAPVAGSTAYDPKQALADAQAVRSRLADRAAAPAYYYPVLGLAVGALVGVYPLDGPSFLQAGVALVCAFTCGFLVQRYRAATGLWVTYGNTGPRAHRAWTCFAVMLFSLLGIAMWAQHAHLPWLGLVLGPVAFVGTLLTGRWIEPRLREEIRSGESSVRLVR